MVWLALLAAPHITYGIAWKISLAPELFGTDCGLGYLLMDAQSNDRIDLVSAICLIIVYFTRLVKS